MSPKKIRKTKFQYRKIVLSAFPPTWSSSSAVYPLPHFGTTLNKMPLLTPASPQRQFNFRQLLFFYIYFENLLTFLEKILVQITYISGLSSPPPFHEIIIFFDVFPFVAVLGQIRLRLHKTKKGTPFKKRHFTAKPYPQYYSPNPIRFYIKIVIRIF